MSVVDVEFIATANFSSLIAQANAANASLAKLQATTAAGGTEKMAMAFSQFTGSLTNSGRFVSQMVNIQNSTNAFGKSLMAGKLTLAEYKRELTAYVMQREGMIDKLAAQNVRMAQSTVISRGINPATGQMMAQVLTSQGALSTSAATQAALATQRMQVLNKVLLQGSHSLINWGKNTQWAGRQMMVGLSMPLLVIGSLAAKTFFDFDRELTRMVKVYGNGLSELTLQQAEAMKAQARQTSFELAKMYGTPIKQTAELFGTIAQAGYEGADLVKNVELTTQLATLGSVDSQQAWQSVLTLQNAFRISTDDLQGSLDFLNATENSTVLSLQDVTAAIPRAAPAVRALGGDIKDLAAYLVAMREGGVPAAEAANAIKSSLASLINPTRKTRDVLNGFGIDLKKIVQANAGDLTKTILAVQKAFDQLDPLQRTQSIAQAFGKFQFSKITALLNNLGKEGSQTQKVFELMNFTTGQLAVLREREINRLQNTASGKFKRAWGEISTDLAKFGEKFLGIATKVVQVVGRIFDLFDRLPKGVKGFLGTTVLLAAFVGPIVMLTGVLANFMGYITMGLVRLRMFAKGGATAWAMMTPEMVAAQKTAEVFDTALMKQTDNIEILNSAMSQLIKTLQTIALESNAASQGLNTVAASAGGAAAGANIARSSMIPPGAIQAGHTIAKAAVTPILTPLMMAANPGMSQQQVGKMSEKGILLTGGSTLFAETKASNLGSTRDKSMSFFGGGKNFQQIAQADAALMTAQNNIRMGITSNGEALTGYANKLSQISVRQMAKINSEIVSSGGMSQTAMEMISKATKIPLDQIPQALLEYNAMVEQEAIAVAARFKQISKMKEIQIREELEQALTVVANQIGLDEKQVATSVVETMEAIDLAVKNKTINLKTMLAQVESSALAATTQNRYGALSVGGRGLPTSSPMAQGNIFGSAIPGARVGVVMSPEEKALLVEQIESTKQNSAILKEVSIALKEDAAATEINTATQAKGNSDEELNTVALEELSATERLRIATGLSGPQVVPANAKMLPIVAGPGTKPGGGPGTQYTPGVIAGKAMMPAMGVGMGLTMGSMMAHGEAQQTLMKAGMFAMFAPMLLQIKSIEKALFAASVRMRALTIAGGATGKGITALKSIGPMVFNPWTLAIGATVIAIIAVKNAMDKAKEKTASFGAAGDRYMTLLDAKTNKLKVSTTQLSDSIDDTSAAYESAKNVIEQLPETDPIKKFIDDIKKEADAGSSIPKKIAAMYAEGILSGVDPEKLKTNLQVALDLAGQKEYTAAVKLKISSISIENKKSIYDAMFKDSLDIYADSPERGKRVEDYSNRIIAQRKRLIDYMEKNKVSIVADMGGDEEAYNKQLNNLKNLSTTQKALSTGWTAGPLSGEWLKNLPKDISDAGKEADNLSNSLSRTVSVLGGDELKTFAGNIGTAMGYLQSVDPSKLSSSMDELVSNSSLITQYDQQRVTVQQTLMDQLGLSADYQSILVDKTLDAKTFMQMTMLAAGGISPALISAARAAGTLSTVLATTQAINTIPVADPDKLRGILGPQKTTTPGSAGSGGGDPYKSQKDANTKRIDQEKEIIKAIEKKRDADKKAFDEKKKQNDYLSKQADQQIKYREALAIGDFGAAALAKNQMIADQNAKALDDEQQRKDDAYQKQIDKHQAIIDNIEKANKGLDALSQKAVSASAAVTSTAQDNYTSVHDVYNKLMEDSKTQGFANAQQMKDQYPEVARKIDDLGGNVKGFFDYAFEQHNKTIQNAISDAGIVDKKVSAELLALGASGLEIEKLAAIKDPKEKMDAILDYVKTLKRLSNIANATPEDYRTSDQGASGGLHHSGGFVGDRMVQSRNKPSMRSRLYSDEMMVIAQQGEYMINASAAGIIGRKNLDALNSGKIPAVPVSAGGGGSNYNFTVNAAPGQDPRQIAQEVHRIFQINERRKGGARK